MPTSVAPPALRPLRASLLHTVLDDYASKISLDGAAKILLHSATLAQALTDWIRSSHRDVPYSITVPTSGAEDYNSEGLLSSTGAKVVESVPDDAFSHCFAEIRRTGRQEPERIEILRVLKSVYYALVPKGYAIVLFAKPGSMERILDAVMGSNKEADIDESKQVGFGVDEGVLIDIAEEAQFERGKIRWSERRIVLTDTELGQVVHELERYFQDLLGQCEEGKGWKRRLHAEIDAEVKQNRGLLVEARLMMAMKWDLLCA